MAVAVPYLIVGAIGLVGEWLLGPKSSAASNTQPSTMPSVNQALRGTPLYISFGQVRVSAQITWTKNWKATRMKSGGKGGAKGGGSGGMGSAKGGGSAGASYTYSWDMIYNFGMVDVPCAVTRAWVGADEVKHATVKAWNTAFDLSIVNELFSGTSKTTTDIQATEFFLSGGFVTGDPLVTTWPYFLSQEGVDCAWPSTVWLGFNQLQLGQTPAIPQISVELSPVHGGSFTAQPQFITSLRNTELGSSSPFGMQGSGQIVMNDENGTSYGYAEGGTNSFSIFDFQHHVLFGYSLTQLRADMLVETGIDPTGYGYNGIFPCPGTQFFYVFLQNGGPPVSFINVFLRYKINASGIVLDGHYVLRTSSNDTFSNSQAACFTSDANFAYYLITNDNNTDNGFVVRLPLTGSLIDTSVGSFYTYRTMMSGWGTNVFPGIGSVPRHLNIRGTLIVDTDGKMYVMQYIGQAEFDYWVTGAHTTNTRLLAMTGPGTWFGLVVGGPSLVNFSLDSMTNRDGSASADYNNDYMSPSTFNVNGMRYIAFTRPYTLAADMAPTGSLIRVRIYTCDLPNATFTSFNDTINSYFDPIANLGVDPANRNLVPAQFGMIGFNSVTSALYLMANFDYVGGILFGYQVYNQWGAFSEGVTPPYIIKRILTSPIFGFQTSALFGFAITDASIDTDSYNDAVAKCEAEGIQIAVAYTNQDSVLKIINDLLAVYGGTLAEHGGKIYFDVYRASDVPIRTVDNNHLVVTAPGAPPVHVVKGATQDGFNSVLYQYQDRMLDYRQNQVNLSDEVDIDNNGYRNKVYPSQYVMTGSLAAMVAERALWSNLFGRDNYTFQCGWKDSDLRPGNQITLVDSWHPSLSKGVRVVVSKIAESARGIFDITATRVYANHLTAQHGYTATASVDPGVSGMIVTAGPMMAFAAYELPAEFQAANNYVYFGYNQSTFIMGAQLYISTDLGANYAIAQDMQPYSIGGRVAQALPYRISGFVEHDVEMYILPSSAFTVNTPDFVTNYSFDDMSPAVRQTGATVIVVGSEAMAMENATLIGQNHYKIKNLYRGWGGTPIAAVNSGDFWHQHGSGTFLFTVTQDDIGTKLYYKIVGYDFSGHAYPVSSVAAQNYTVKGLKWLPRIATPLRTFVQSAVTWSASQEFRGDLITVVSGGCDIGVGWPAASNADGFGAGGFGHGGFGHFEPDTAGLSLPNYRFEVQSINGTSVFSTVTYTGWYNYSLAQNSTNFGGFAKNVQYKVTPFNVRGDGPGYSTRSLGVLF